MAGRYVRSNAGESGVSLRFYRAASGVARHPRAELGTRADAELQIDAPHVRLDGLLTHEGRPRNLTVGDARCGELRHSELRRGQFIRRATPRSDQGEFVVCPAHPRLGSQALEDRDGLAQ